MSETIARAAGQVRTRAPGARPRIAVILGSGWGDVTAHVQDPVRVPYADIEGFPAAGVQGHSGELWLGRIGAHEVAVLSGRKHVYEEGDVQAMKVPLLTLQALGCQELVQTNAAGSLDEHMPAGSLMVLSDHINPSQRTPLLGETGTGRFVDMANAYDAGLRGIAKAVAAKAAITLHEGVYVWHLGPQFETPAEIRMFKAFGGNAVGMSTVPETILARRAGMRVLALSLITNMACGLSDETLSHAHTLAQAKASSAAAATFLRDVIAAIDP